MSAQRAAAAPEGEPAPTKKWMGSEIRPKAMDRIIGLCAGLLFGLVMLGLLLTNDMNAPTSESGAQ